MAVSTVLSKVKALLQRAKGLLDSDVENLNTLLHRLKVQELKMLAKEFCIHLTGSLRKDDIIKRMMGMACIRALQHESDEKTISKTPSTSFEAYQHLV